MRELVLLVLAAAWLAVLVPPFLRSRMENRPNSSVTDFRSKLNKLQSTVPGRASGSMRAAGSMGRPLAPSPLQRPAAGGRPGAPAPSMRRSGMRTHGGASQRSDVGRRSRTHGPVREAPARRPRTHGAPAYADFDSPPVRRGRDDVFGDEFGRERRTQRTAARHAAPHRRTQVARRPDEDLRRRRTNVLVMLLFTTGGSLFLAATTKESALLYLFATSFIALVGYVYMLSQYRQREASAWPSDWMR